MAMSFRQLWASGEPSQFQTISGFLRRHALSTPLDTFVLLDHIGERYRTARRLVMMKEVWADDPVGEPKHVIRAEQVIEDWLYSGPFHANKTKIERVKRWSTTSYGFCLAKAIRAMVGVMWELHIVVVGATAGLPAAA